MATTHVADQIPESHLDLLSAAYLAHMATIGPDGEPQSSPVWFDWDGEHLLVGLMPSRQKHRNLQRDPRVALSIVDRRNAGRYLEIRGRVVAVDPDPDRAAMKRILRKYVGTEDFPGAADHRDIFVIEPVRVSYMG